MTCRHASLGDKALQVMVTAHRLRRKSDHQLMGQPRHDRCSASSGQASTVSPLVMPGFQTATNKQSLGSAPQNVDDELDNGSGGSDCNSTPVNKLTQDAMLVLSNAQPVPFKTYVTDLFESENDEDEDCGDNDEDVEMNEVDGRDDKMAADNGIHQTTTDFPFE